MCFYSTTNKTKIANKPIKVYKILENNGNAPIMPYKYYRGLNIPERSYTNCTYNKYDAAYVYEGGWLHALKHIKKKDCKYLGHCVVVMFIPRGYEYHDSGVNVQYSSRDCTKDIISKGLYWPKNRFDYIKWYIKSIF